ncbi:MAG: hypothetical protein KAR40_09715 [Candidatus Sabulitectum sp.]|nr:hypothetical protein [Candidatus Sabulitectum sp.]
MPDKIMQALACLPFMATVGGKPKLNTARILEIVIAGAIGGIFIGYVLAKELKIEVTNLKNSVERVEQRVDKIYADVYKPHIEGGTDHVAGPKKSH